MKRVILCLDGTWNNNRAGSTLTNVCKLHQVIAADSNGVQQISHYVEGIVSAEGESLQFVKGGVGFGVDDRIRTAYETLCKDYEPGDEIYLIGFSRGAFEARSLGGFITLFGVARNGGAFSFDKAWSLYRTSGKARDQAALAQLHAAAHYPVRIRCVGVWDTVGNLGNPFVSGGALGRRYEFHDTRLSDNIDVGLHALSIDELRGPFRPTLWTLPKGQSLPANQHVEQVWFAGTHADVGGGHRETALSDVALLWMAERLQTTTGLALDMHELGHMTRPDSLGPQHSVAEGWIFTLSGLFPFIRLVKQAMEAIPPLRRMLIGSWRTGKLSRNEVAVNESVHDSVLERFGERVIELRYGRSRTIAYRPRNLAAAIPEWRAREAKPKKGEPRRIKIFTVHGTFAHEADWDNWDAKDDAKKEQRAFVNRLAAHLKEQGVVLDELDHTQYNWTGGNSHDERRVAAIGLKKLIQEELGKVYERHGKDYYDKVFIIGHSHGGTISRLAMNLWDKDDEYYDPVRNAQLDEFKLDDQCPTCLRTRNGLVGRNSVRRPDGVVTFGSPFVSFERRTGGLFTARLSTWVFRLMVAIPLGLALFLAYQNGAYQVVSGMWEWTLGPVKTILLLTWPLALCWLVVSYLPRQLDSIERWFGKSNPLFALSAVVQGVKYLVLAGVAVYYLVYATGQHDRVLQWLPWANESFQAWLAWLHLLTVVLFVLFALPGSFLSWLKREVVGLREKLPVKYDPAEDRPVSYVSYHTPGDEAGLHLRTFGVITWAVQTLALSAVSVLAFGIALIVVIGIESALGLSQGGALLDRLGISAVSDFPEFRDRFIVLIDGLTYLPRLAWSQIVAPKLVPTLLPTLGELGNQRAVVWFIPVALVVAILLIFLLLMPFVVLAIAIAYLVSMWLRGSGVVFGSEKLSWNLANRITVTRHANANTAVRLFFISLEAWWRRDFAHCYYYKSNRVIGDVAEQIADWTNHKPTPVWPVEAWVGGAARLLVVLLFVLTIFTASVPIAMAFAKSSMFLGELVEPALKREPSFGEGTGSLPEPKDADGYIERARMFRAKGHHARALVDCNKAIALEPDATAPYNARASAYNAKGDYDLAIADLAKVIELKPNAAGAYNNRGNVYQRKGANDLAIADFTKAIELDANSDRAFRYRGLAHQAKGDFDLAIADFTKVIELDPSAAQSFNNRGFAYRGKGDNDLAIADYTKAIELDPKNPGSFRLLGLAKYSNGDFQGAAADLLPAVALDDAYAMLFRYLARTRAGEAAAAELEANGARLKTKEWPYAVVEFYLGKRSPSGTLDVAAKPAALCEAHYFIGQWHVLKNNVAEATRSLQVAADTCPKNFVEYRAAVDELKRLNR